MASTATTPSNPPSATAGTIISSHDPSKVIKIGLGVAIPLGFVMLALIGCVFWKRHKKDTKDRDRPSQNEGWI